MFSFQPIVSKRWLLVSTPPAWESSSFSYSLSMKYRVTIWYSFILLKTSVRRRIQLAEKSLGQCKHHGWTDALYPTTCWQRFVTIFLVLLFFLLLVYLHIPSFNSRMVHWNSCTNSYQCLSNRVGWRVRRSSFTCSSQCWSWSCCWKCCLHATIFL